MSYRKAQPIRPTRRLPARKYIVAPRWAPFGTGSANHGAPNSRSSAIPHPFKFRPSTPVIPKPILLELLILPARSVSGCQFSPLQSQVPSTTLSIMASIVRPSLLRQTALAARCAKPAFRNNAIKASAFHTSSQRSAFLPPGPREKFPPDTLRNKRNCF